MTVRFTRRSRSDVGEIFAYLEERSSHGAQNVKRAVRKTLDLIGDHPHIGRLSGEQNTRVLRAGRYPYLIYWDIDGKDVVVVHIRHAARESWKRQT